MKKIGILFFTAIIFLSFNAESQVKCPQELIDSGGICLTKEQKEKIVESVKEAISIGLKKYGRDAKITVIPQGPYVIPLLSKRL